MQWDTTTVQPPRCYPASVMETKGLTPILNVSNIADTFAWFEKWGWKKLWDWGTPPTFGAVGSGNETCIFVCQGAQGGRGRGANTTTFQQDGDEEEEGDKGVWISVGGNVTPSTASPPGWRSHFRLPICRGSSARCTSAIPMATYSGSAEDSRKSSKPPLLKTNEFRQLPIAAA